MKMPPQCGGFLQFSQYALCPGPSDLRWATGTQTTPHLKAWYDLTRVDLLAMPQVPKQFLGSGRSLDQRWCGRVKREHSIGT